MVIGRECEGFWVKMLDGEVVEELGRWGAHTGGKRQS